MTLLAIVPTERELAYFDEGLRELTDNVVADTIGALPVMRYPTLGMATAPGGLGKAQFAAQTQHLIENGEWELVVCAGAAGGLVDGLTIGDVIIATETIEHDIRPYNAPRIPRFPAAPAALERSRAAIQDEWDFTVHFGAVASGDEDVVYEDRRAEVKNRTGAIAVAWEGAGGARACELSGMPFLEVRGISDTADTTTFTEFVEALPLTLRNVMSVVVAIAKG